MSGSRKRSRASGSAGPSGAAAQPQARECDVAVRRVLATVDLHKLHALLRAPLADGGLALDADEATQSVTEALRHLALKAAYKDFNATAFSCSAHLDGVWHAMLLHPVLYRAVCDALCGKGILLDHDPSAGAAALATQRAQRLAHTRVAYEREYGAPPPAMWRDDYQPPSHAQRAAFADDGSSLLSDQSSDSDAARIVIRVKQLTGKIATLRVAPGATIEAFKERLYAHIGLPVDQQRLIFGGAQLEDGRTLEEYGIREGDTLQLVLRLIGC